MIADTAPIMACGVLIDPFVFMTPADGREMWLAFIENMVSWSSLLQSRDCCTSEVAVSQLRAINRYPTYEAVKLSLSKFKIIEYSVQDIQNTLRVLSERSPYAEERLRIRDVAADTTIAPSSVSGRLPPSVASALLNVLVAGVLANRDSKTALPTLGSYNVLADSGELAEEVVIKSQVSLVEDDEGEVAPMNVVVEETLDLWQGHPEHCSIAWSWTDSALDPAACARYVLEELRRNDVTLPSTVSLTIGANFADSLRRKNLLARPSILRKVYKHGVLAALGKLATTSGADVHAVRESAAADAPQVKRGEDLKWRCQVTRKGAGFRLQYWQLGSNGGVELDEVLVESEV